MSDLSSNLPQIITAAAQSMLGIMALLSLALSVLAYFFFAQASEKVKVGIFAMLFVGVAGFGVAMFNSGGTEAVAADEVAPSEAQPEALHAEPAAGDPYIGHWQGEARDADGGRFDVDIHIDQACATGQACGTIRVSSGPCEGRLTLKQNQGGDHEFSVDHFSADSAASCAEGDGEHLRLLQDGTLRYTTSYEPKASATLTRQ